MDNIWITVVTWGGGGIFVSAFKIILNCGKRAFIFYIRKPGSVHVIAFASSTQDNLCVCVCVCVSMCVWCVQTQGFSHCFP